MSSPPPEPSPQLLNRIADALSRPIPKPALRPVKPQKSWRTLRPGQRLQLKTSFFQSGGSRLPEGTILEIKSADSLGIFLTHYSEESKLKTTIRWTDREWERFFQRVRGKKEKKG